MRIEERLNFREEKLRDIYQKIKDVPAGSLQLQAIIMKQNKEKVSDRIKEIEEKIRGGA